MSHYKVLAKTKDQLSQVEGENKRRNNRLRGGNKKVKEALNKRICVNTHRGGKGSDKILEYLFFKKNKDFIYYATKL